MIGMAEDLQPVPEPPEVPEENEKEDDIGDFINRHVFERDSVFFEG
jgi:hypothetical protein